MSRRWSGRWGREPEPLEPVVEVLIPTVGRAAELSATLAGLAAQEDPPFDVVISDQSEHGIRGEPSVAAMLRVLEAQGRGVRVEDRKSTRLTSSHVSRSYAVFCLKRQNHITSLDA